MILWSESLLFCWKILVLGHVDFPLLLILSQTVRFSIPRLLSFTRARRFWFWVLIDFRIDGSQVVLGLFFDLGISYHLGVVWHLVPSILWLALPFVDLVWKRVSSFWLLIWLNILWVVLQILRVSVRASDLSAHVLILFTFMPDMWIWFNLSKWLSIKSVFHECSLAFGLIVELWTQRPLFLFVWEALFLWLFHILYYYKLRL